jgi:hypothetical protein
VGALADPDGARAPLDRPGFGKALIAAALDCAADVPPRQRRFLIPDRRQSRLAASELRVLTELTLAGPARGRAMLDAVNSELARRREDLAREHVIPSA